MIDLFYMGSEDAGFPHNVEEHLKLAKRAYVSKTNYEVNYKFSFTTTLEEIQGYIIVEDGQAKIGFHDNEFYPNEIRTILRELNAHIYHYIAGKYGFVELSDENFLRVHETMEEMLNNPKPDLLVIPSLDELIQSTVPHMKKPSRVIDSRKFRWGREIQYDMGELVLHVTLRSKPISMELGDLSRSAFNVELLDLEVRSRHDNGSFGMLPTANSTSVIMQAISVAFNNLKETRSLLNYRHLYDKYVKETVEKVVKQTTRVQ